VACDILLERSRQWLQLCFKPHLNQRSSRKVMGPQSRRRPNYGNFEIPLESPRTKWHLGAGLVARHKVYYKGEGGGFPQVRALMNLVSPTLHVVHPCNKVLQLRTNQLVVWFVQVRVSNWCLSLFLVPILELRHTLLPPKCCELGSVPQILILLLFLLQIHI